MKRRKIDLRELQLIELDILRVFDTLCKEHGITYYLAYGTLLGAVRHKGFIPWDDDIDVLVPRPDYERLATILKHGTLPGGYGYGSLEDPGYVYPYMKIFRKDSMVIERKFEEKFRETQIWIDIFPMDGVRSGTVSMWWTFFITKMLRNFLYTVIVDPTTLSGMEKYGTLLIKPWARMFGAHRIARWLDRFARRHDYAVSKLIGNIAWGEGSFEAIDKNIFLPSAPLVFEDGEFSSPLHYDQHLKDLYGSYMELPPPEMRKSHLGEDSFVFF